MYRVFLNKLIGPLGIILLSFIIIFLWFNKGLLFGGGEDELMFYNPTKTFELNSSVWYETDTGYQSIVNIARFSPFWLLSKLSAIGLSNVFLQAITYLFLIITGCLSIFFLLKITVVEYIDVSYKKFIPIIGGIFYLLNPYSMNQLWGRGILTQFFAFALVPCFLLLFTLGLIKRNLIYAFYAVLASFIFSASYAQPAYVITSWASVSLFFLFYLINNRKKLSKVIFGIAYMIVILIIWTLVNWFWINPLLIQRGQLLEVSSVISNVESLKGVSIHTPLQTIIRLMHNGAYYVDELYGSYYRNPPFLMISWLIPVIALFSFNTLKESKYFKFYLLLFIIALFIGIGYNFPSGWLLAWIFEKFPYIQVLRNPYEKFGINLMIAYTVFFSVGVMIFSEKIAKYLKKPKLNLHIVALNIFLISVVFVWPMWNGSFAGGYKFNPWVGVPKYYNEANEWLNKQNEGNFRLLQVPLSPGDGVKYTWEHAFQGIEPSELLFSKSSIARDIGFNKNYYSVLVERFGKIAVGAYLPGRGTDNKDFKEEYLYQELVKLNVRYIILHNDIDWKFGGSVSPEKTKQYLASQPNINKIITFGQLDIYRVEYPINIDLLYSPSTNITYKKENSTHYIVDVKNSTEPFNLYFLNLFDPMWQADINGQRIDRHYKVFSYANGWTLNKTGNYQVSIKFTLQDSVYTGEKIAFSTIAILLLILAGYFLKVRKNLF